MPNVHGKCPDGVQFLGIALCLSHGVAVVCWDGRALCHCTSIPMPDVLDGGRARKIDKTTETTVSLEPSIQAAKQKISAAIKPLNANP